ncbi:MAG: uncharacterized protein KVP18_002188 [Porospora cf. gigantea A]|uniref:uncharacterized protein n=1 Tax=Porospora cf. gigantea A TaxID=2853593 RepID=UPI00355AB5EB|nr:MAG: hypothetical protein KVP18_002188 [Porospora cf. gigantea A]
MGCCESAVDKPVVVEREATHEVSLPAPEPDKPSDLSTTMPPGSALSVSGEPVDVPAVPAVVEAATTVPSTAPAAATTVPSTAPAAAESGEPVAEVEMTEQARAENLLKQGFAEGEGGFLLFSRADQGRLDICWSRKGAQNVIIAGRLLDPSTVPAHKFRGSGRSLIKNRCLADPAQFRFGICEYVKTARRFGLEIEMGDDTLGTEDISVWLCHAERGLVRLKTGARENLDSVLAVSVVPSSKDIYKEGTELPAGKFKEAGILNGAALDI